MNAFIQTNTPGSITFIILPDTPLERKAINEVRRLPSFLSVVEADEPIANFIGHGWDNPPLVIRFDLTHNPALPPAAIPPQKPHPFYTPPPDDKSLADKCLFYTIWFGIATVFGLATIIALFLASKF